jgi:peptidoglycan/LPS O-acetylase OafA/YrhL
MAAEANGSTFKLGHRPALDGVRGVSILVVMFEHGFLFKYGRGGFLGVDIFFVLSGLLITSLLAQEWQETSTLSFKNFYARRALRLLPALFALVIFTSIQVLIFPPAAGRAAVFRHLLGVLFYVENWAGGYTVIGHTWSLSIEEQFYIAWPIIFFFLLKLKLSPRKMIAVLAALIGLVAVHRAQMFYRRYGFVLPEFELSLLRLYTGTDTRCDSLLLGCIAGIILSWKMAPQRRWVIAWWRVIVAISGGLIAAAIFIVPIYWNYLYLGGFTVFGALVASATLFILTSSNSLLTRLMQWPVLTWFGRISYSLYIWHVTVYGVYVNNFGPLPIKSYTLKITIPLAIKFVASVLVACASFYLLERPFLRMKKRFSVVDGGARPDQKQTHISSPEWAPAGNGGAIASVQAELPGTVGTI